MFICRFRLLPKLAVAPSPSLHSHVIITQRLLSRSTTPLRQCSRVSVSPPPPPSAHAFQRDLSPTDDIRISDPLPELLTRDTNEQPSTTSSQGEAKKKDDMGQSSTLSNLYTRLNVPEFSKLATQLSEEQVRNVALRAQKARHRYVLDNLTRNILDSPEAVRAELATAMLSSLHVRLDPSLTLSLFFCITPDHHSSLSLDLLCRIACALIHHPSSSNTETFLTRLAEDITHRLELFRRRKHGRGGHVPPVWDLFRLVMYLSELHMREHATRVLQSLVEMAYVPPEAIQRMDQSSGDFHLIITLTLVRSCIFWKWNVRALALLRSYLGWKPSADPIINSLCQDVLHALMEFPTVRDLDLGVSFVKDMLSSPEPILVSPDIVRQIYSNAQRLRQPQIAVDLYNLTQREPIRSLYKFPLPSGTALTWFLRHLSDRAAYLHLARHLVTEVVDRCEPIPLADRAAFIAIAAESGFARSARVLWERYSSGSSGRIVVGNAAMMVRICSLFANLRRGKGAHKVECSGLTDSIVDGGPHNNVNDHRTPFLEDEEDFRNFAQLVLTRYREAKEPLHHASREDLNALARANVILGDITEAFRVLKVVVDRNERPDLHDVNVVLSAIANVDPRLALKMVRRMVEIGPKPDAISFGTVIHQAARQGDIGVVIGALRLARETGQQLTTKTVVAVIRASVAFSGEDMDALRDNLVHALEVIVANEHSNHLATQNMGRFCLDEALRADDPTLAFLFWQRVLRPIAEWDDGSHVSARRRIARAIRLQCKKGGISIADGHRMTYALGKRGKGGHG